MSTLYPGALDDNTTLPNPSALNPTNNPSLSAMSSNEHDAIKAIEAKLGTSASTPTANNLLVGTGVGTSTWSKASPTGTIVGTTDSQTLTNKTITGGTISGATISNPTLTVDSVNEFTAANGVTIDGVLLKDSKMNGSYITDGTVANAQLANGVVVQVVSTNFTNAITGTTQIPLDNTIPQNTEGFEVMTQAITPKSATNILVIDATVFMASDTAGRWLTAALFQDSTVNALAVDASFLTTATGVITIPLSHSMVAGTTSSTTFKIRIGTNNTGTTSFNASAAGSPLFGATTKSFIRITEHKA